MNLKKSSGGEKSKNFLTNRYVLIFVFILSIGNVVELATKSDYTTIAILLLVGLITSFFSKNMIVIMIVALTVANVLKLGTKITNPWKGNEGFVDNSKEEDEGEKEKEGFKSTDDEVEEAVETGGEEKEEVAEVPKSGKKDKEEMTIKNTPKQDMIEKDALDDLRAEMKIGFKRLNQNIDSISSMNLFN